MSLMPVHNGEYDEHGVWQSHKKCFVYCGEACDCGAPFGRRYSPLLDQKLQLSFEDELDLQRRLINSGVAKNKLPPLADPWNSWRPERTIC